MKCETFTRILSDERVQNNTVNGFSVYFSNSYYAIVEGIKPVTFVREISDDRKNNLGISVIEETNDMCKYHICTPEGLRYVIKSIKTMTI